MLKIIKRRLCINLHCLKYSNIHRSLYGQHILNNYITKVILQNGKSDDTFAYSFQN